MLTATPSAPPPDWEAHAAALLDRAAALGRRDGLEGIEDVPDWPEAELLRPLPLAGKPPRLLLLALRHCYVAGHRHGSDVRRENDRRAAPERGGAIARESVLF
ncbi:hypothetical protein NON00_17430 [Roseomonas sp. GC11]|uniref:hypothetical protein n=1 Tax=Roseomonas sp. GC11 TaxID=2950546 RepID=UPI00210D642C|nr:hypothetical protein [Roseomonas sp. GC11]MCQ4161699.1 hypothetical protein [Roseomonas sp. GC11]